jgi:hypothetical protein
MLFRLRKKKEKKRKERKGKEKKPPSQKRKKYATLTANHRDSSGSSRESSGKLEKLPLGSFNSETMQKGENLSLPQVHYF